MAHAQGTGTTIRHGGTLPASCVGGTGQIFVLNSGTTGTYECKTNNTWTLVGVSTDCTPTVHGLVPTPPNDATKVLGGTCTWVSLTKTFGTSFGDSAGLALTSGSVVYFTIPYACTISAFNITVDAGTVTFDVWKIATGTAIPTVANTITASALPALSTGTALHSTTLTAWTTAVTAGDIFGIQLKTVATAKYAQINLECQ